MNASPTIVDAYAPGRVVLIGDHTDYAGGLSMPMAIDRGTSVIGRRSGDRVRLHSSAMNGIVDLGLHPDPLEERGAPRWGRFVRGVIDAMGLQEGFVGEVTSTLPIGAGLSSSAAFEVALALAFGFSGHPDELAALCQRAEQLAVGVPCGPLDQMASVHGRRDSALLLDFEHMSVEPLPLPDGIDVIVVDSRQVRSLDESAYGERRAQCAAAAERLGPLRHASPAATEALADPVLRRRARHVGSECRRVVAAADALWDGDMAQVGALMVESHRSLSEDFEVSTPLLDSLVDELLRRPGVFGARLTGAGFGGCVVALCESGAIDDPAALTGRGWVVRPAAGARIRLAAG